MMRKMNPETEKMIKEYLRRRKKEDLKKMRVDPFMDLMALIIMISVPLGIVVLALNAFL